MRALFTMEVIGPFYIIDFGNNESQGKNTKRYERDIGATGLIII